MEDSFRMFVEECDNLQGIQLNNETATFGSFTATFLSRFRDEFAKLPSLTFPLLSSSVPGFIDADDARGVRKALNDALYLKTLSELSTIIVPIQSPKTWNSGAYANAFQPDFRSSYCASAIISTHIEDVTLPLRLRETTEDLSSLASFLNWRNNTKFSQLSGVFPCPAPITSSKDLEQPIFDLSVTKNGVSLKRDPFSIIAQFDITRGFSQTERTVYKDWSKEWRPLPRSIHAPAIPIPTSFPSFSSSTASPRPGTVPAFSSLCTGTRSASLFANYASLVEQTVGKHGDVIARMGLEMDEIRELKEGLWALEDAYRGDENYLAY